MVRLSIRTCHILESCRFRKGGFNAPKDRFKAVPSLGLALSTGTTPVNTAKNHSFYEPHSSIELSKRKLNAVEKLGIEPRTFSKSLCDLLRN